MTEVTSSLAYFWGFVGSASECSALSKDDSLEFGPQREVAPAAGLAPLAEATAGLAVGLAIGAGTAAFAVGVIHQAWMNNMERSLYKYRYYKKGKGKTL